MEFLFIGSSTMVIFFLMLLLFKSGKTLSDWILTAWFFIMLMHTLTFYILSTPSQQPHIILELSDALAAAHGPVMLFYVNSLIQPNFRFQWIDSLHLVLPISAFGIFMGCYTLTGHADCFGVRNSWSILKSFVILFYSIFVFIKIKKHQKLVPHLFSSKENVNLTWFSQTIIGVISLFFVGVLSAVFANYSNIEIPHYGGFYINIFASIGILILGFNGIRQTQIFTQSIKLDVTQNDTAKYEHSGLSSKDAEKMYEKLLAFINKNKIYLDPQLSLSRLAEQSGFPSHHISQIINTYARLNFFDFINQFRVEAVKEKIQDSSYAHLTLLGIGLESGFNSKASFNRAFKKFTGMTPSSYRKKLQQE